MTIPLEFPTDKKTMNAAGTLGFALNPSSSIDLSQLGVFVTNPVSLTPRTPAQGTRLIPFPGGVLMHTGHPNPGLRTIVKHFSPRWTRSPLPVIVHILAENPEAVGQMVETLEDLEGVIGVELGLHPGADEQGCCELTRAGLGELPLIVRLPVDKPIQIAEAVIESGASAISLAPLRGMLPDLDGNLVRGRLYGPVMFPIVLAKLNSLVAQKIPTFAAGGIYNQRDVRFMLDAGASAVQIDITMWRGGLREH